MDTDDIRYGTSDFVSLVMSEAGLPMLEGADASTGIGGSVRIDIPVAYRREGYALRVSIAPAGASGERFRVEPTIVRDGDPIGCCPFPGFVATADEDGAAMAADAVRRDAESLAGMLSPRCHEAVA